MTYKKLTTAIFNVNSIRSRLGLVLDWLDHHRPDILCLQETKVQDQDFPVAPFQDAGFHVTFRGQKAHAGTAIISKGEPDTIAFGLDDGVSRTRPG